MPIFRRFRRVLQRPHCSALSALLAICIGWSLALTHAAQQSSAQIERDNQDSTRVRFDAELRMGEPAEAPVADVAEANASLRALPVRARYTPQQHPFASSGNGNASAALLAALSLQLGLRARAPSESGDGVESTPHRVIARRWPLPRSSCSDSDPDADAARRS